MKSLSVRTQNLLFGIFCIALIVLGILFRSSIHEFLKSNHLLPEPEPLTELYFEDHQNLPSVLIPGKTETIRFTIHNIEYKPMNYTYTVSYEHATGSGIIASGSATLIHEAFQTITQDFTLTDATRTAVLVTLQPNGEKLQVWLEPKN